MTEPRGVNDSGVYLLHKSQGGGGFSHLVLLFTVISIHQRHHVLHPLQPSIRCGEGVAAVAEPLVEDVLAVGTQREAVVGRGDRVGDA